MLATSDTTSLAAARAVLLNGGVLVFPTETVYGMGVLFGDARAEEKLRRLKGRDAAKPFQVLVPDAAAAEKAAVLTPAARRVLAKFWPGALTAVLPARANPAMTIGLRAPDHPWLQALLRTLPAGITATSANLAGEPPARTAAEAEAAVGGLVELVLDGGPSALGRASTVAGLVNDELKIFREGAVTETMLRETLADRP